MATIEKIVNNIETVKSANLNILIDTFGWHDWFCKDTALKNKTTAFKTTFDKIAKTIPEANEVTDVYFRDYGVFQGTSFGPGFNVEGQDNPISYTKNTVPVKAGQGIGSETHYEIWHGINQEFNKETFTWKNDADKRLVELLKLAIQGN